MIEIFLLFCFIAVLSAVVSAVRGVAMVLGVVWKRLSFSPSREYPIIRPETNTNDPRSDHAVGPRN